VLQSKSLRGRPFLWEGARKREGRWPGSGRGRERSVASFSSCDLGPTGARHARTVRDAPADSPRGAWTVRTQGADDPLLLPECLVMHLLPMSRADGPRGPGGQSARSSRTVRPIAVDGTTSLFNFSLI
jgi:hypothetical protein